MKKIGALYAMDFISHSYARDPYMYMDERAKERRDAQAVTDAKQEQSFVIKTGLSLTEAVIFSAL